MVQVHGYPDVHHPIGRCSVRPVTVAGSEAGWLDDAKALEEVAEWGMNPGLNPAGCGGSLTLPNTFQDLPILQQACPPQGAF